MTLNVIQTVFGKVLACFTSIPWRNLKVEAYVEDKKAFIALINLKFKAKSIDSSKSVFHSNTRLFRFGEADVTVYYKNRASSVDLG